ncbi:MAG: DNA-processing protein DprA [Acidimicrobiia bacterium]|nr:DNA-processing protein DprA [Acidimicrobiia bacterium]
MIDPDSNEMAAIKLACLPQMTPVRLRALLAHWGGPSLACAAIIDGVAADALTGRLEHKSISAARAWTQAIAIERPELLARSRGTRAVWSGQDDYPIDEGIPDPPGVLMYEGDRPDAFERPRVAVVGTRSASPHGLKDAYEIGAALARAGVVVVSGLAIGIDAAAHHGALDAGGPVIGIIATGLDVVYPRRHNTLYDRVRRGGLIVSEQPFGMQPRRELFPIRNRIIAALGDVTAVIEATVTGGARITAKAAVDYGRHVLAMPGSRRNPSAAGCNDMLRLGEAHPLVEPNDLLEALGLTAASRRVPLDKNGAPGGTPDERAVHSALHGEPATLDEISARTGLGPSEVARAIAGLVRGNGATRAHGLVWPT